MPQIGILDIIDAVDCINGNIEGEFPLVVKHSAFTTQIEWLGIIIWDLEETDPDEYKGSLIQYLQNQMKEMVINIQKDIKDLP